MAIQPIQIPPEHIHIHADRRLAFQVITAFGRNQEQGQPSHRVLEKRGEDELLVGFNTPVRVLGIDRIFHTVEWVTLTPPEQIDFRLVPGEGPITGGLKLLHDRFVLTDAAGCTNLRYESAFGIRWSVSGWIVGKLLIESLLRKHMREHLVELKATIEARAARSRLYPQAACPHEGRGEIRAA